MEYVLQTKGLTKRYKGYNAVDNIDMHIKKGEIYGFLGQNGAGKTTTLRLLTGLIKPTSGEIELFGQPLQQNKTKVFERIGSTIEYPGFYNNLTVTEVLEIHLYLMGVNEKRVVGEIINKVGLITVKNKKVEELSLGMKQRLGIARALSHQPELLILDEPMNGLDPAGIKEIRNLIYHLAIDNNMTVLMSSHILSEVQQIATKIGIISKGKLIEEISKEELDKKNQQYINLKVDDNLKAIRVLEEKLLIKEFKVFNDETIRIYERTSDVSLINRALIEEEVEIQSSNVAGASLEEYFLQKTGGEFNV
ncbi:TPA: ATP-binding cassette domain-containing protein [Bacillus thuringiensis]|uniref:ATP-binding cassette domain-containing protein n=1 Tax=Bacillus sp. CH_70 TaxID=2978215 RepID=UPI0030F65CA6|nr:ATP-binding cassette domain-containing protein [Bacillus thuringiensis]